MSRMARDTKFGYGFLFVGGGMPYLVDKWFGVLPAMIIAAASVVLGVVFLVAGHLHENASPKQWRIAIAAIAVFSVVTLGWPIVEYAKPSLVVVKPVIWTLPSVRTTEIFVAGALGHETLSDVEVVVTDEDRSAEIKRNPASTPTLLPLAVQRFTYSEMDPGPLWDKLIFINPYIPAHQHYTIDLSFHGSPRARFREDFWIEVEEFAGKRPIDNMSYAIRISDVTDVNTSSVVLECKDLGFPTTPEWSEHLKTCESIFRPLPSQRNLFTRTKAKVRNWWSALRQPS